MSSPNVADYLPSGKPSPVCRVGEFPFAAVALEHGHIYGQCHGLIEAGATLRRVYDPDPQKVKAFCAQFPQARPAASLQEILDDPTIKLVTAAAIPSERGSLGIEIMGAGKDYFTDKAPFTQLDQLETARKAVETTGRKYLVYYGERIHVECAIIAGYMLEQGVIGRIVHLSMSGPHRLNASSRPAWFFKREKTGGILCDLASHQCEQFLYFSGATDARLNFSAAANVNHPEYPELEDFGEISLTASNGISGHLRADWLTPDGLRTWGDGRTLILGTKGYIELRKYVEIAAENPEGEQLYLVDEKGEHRLSCKGKVGFPFFGQLILDCLNRTETAMTQEHAFKAAKLSLLAQAATRR